MVVDLRRNASEPLLLGHVDRHIDGERVAWSKSTWNDGGQQPTTGLHDQPGAAELAGRDGHRHRLVRTWQPRHPLRYESRGDGGGSSPHGTATTIAEADHLTVHRKQVTGWSGRHRTWTPTCHDYVQLYLVRL